MTQLKVCDETTAGEKTGEFVMDLLTERITVRELIRSRVYQEVQDYNVKTPEYFRGLVGPAETIRSRLESIRVQPDFDPGQRAASGEFGRGDRDRAGHQGKLLAIGATGGGIGGDIRWPTIGIRWRV